MGRYGIINEDIYNNYFGLPERTKEEKAKEIKHKQELYHDTHSARLHIKESVSSNEYDMLALRLTADGNIDDIEELANVLKKLCNAAWGMNWGEISPDLKKGENSDEILLPQIVLDINTRDIAEGIGSFKPILTDIIDEKDENGTPTGDAFLIYRQWFDCNVEFCFYGRNNKEARQLQKRFESLITVYTGYLKRQGISEIFFEKETSPKCSLHYDESVPMRCIYYYIRLETVTPVRRSLIDTINLEIGANKISTDKVRTLIESGKSEIIDFDFFDGDNGITYKSDN